MRASSTLLAFSVAAFTTQTQAIDITTTPSWVETQSYSKKIDPEKRIGGKVYLLESNQINHLDSDVETYSRVAVAALNAKGVEDSSQLTISFDPAYEKVELHSLVLWRDGKKINKINDFELKRFKKEKNLEKLLYNGEESYYIILKNVKEGDIVEYSYSKIGINPVFNGEVSQWVKLGYHFSIGQKFARVLLPKDEAYNVTVRGEVDEKKLVRKEFEEHIEYRYEIGQNEYQYFGENPPSWYQPLPYLHVNSYSSWQDVVDWALPLYQPSVSGQGLTTELKRIRSIQGIENQIVAAIKTSQQTIRYLGIENGIGSHAPRTPEQVLKQGYGDCKDKTMLLVSLLNGIGIEAYPALVSSKYRAELVDRPPSHSAFDHAIVFFKYDDEEYWIDPTSTEQADSLETISQSRLGYGLLVKQDEAELTPIPEKSVSEIISKTEVDLSFDEKVPSKMQVTTLYEGHEADRMRRFLSSHSKRDVMSKYRSFYIQYWDSIQFAKAIEISDDKEMNIILIREQYKFDQIWKENLGKRYVNIGSPTISNRILAPKSKHRDAPFNLGEGITIKHQLIINLAKGLDFRGENRSIQSSEFDFQLEGKGVGSTMDHLAKEYKTIEINLSYERNSSYVMPEQVAEYIKNVAKARDWSWFKFTKN